MQVQEIKTTARPGQKRKEEKVSRHNISFKIEVKFKKR
jgi:hypothetical protein